MRTTRLALLCFFVASAPLAAQRSWVVDSNNRPGTDFTDLPAAFSSAQPGDTVTVRDGAYSPALLTKGIRLFGSPGISFRLSLAQLELLHVRGIPAGQTFVMKGFDLADPVRRTALLVTDCAGRIVIEGVQLGQLGNATFRMERPGTVFRRCAQLTVAGTTFAGWPAVLCEDCTAAITSSTFRGADAGQYHERTWRSMPGLVASRSTLTLARSTARGGDGLNTYRGEMIASPALELRDCDTALSGDATARIEAGDIASTPRSAIETTNGALTYDPSVQIIAKGPTTPVSGTARVTTARLPSLTAAGTAPGGVLRTDLFAPRGASQVLAVGLPIAPAPLPIGSLWIDPAALIPVDASVMNASEHRPLGFNVPNAPALRGVPLALQAVANDGGTIRLSNPVVPVLF